MLYKVRFRPEFATLFVTLNPGESITAEVGAMISIDAKVTIKTVFSGGFLNALLRKLFNGESMFVNVLTNKTDQPLDVVLSQSVMGDIERINLTNSEICVQSGAYLAHTPGVNMGIHWAGFSNWLAGAGLFTLKFSGNGRIFIATYGGITKKLVYGEFIVDNSYLVAYSPKIKMNIKSTGRLFNFPPSREGLINHLIGSGTIYLQSRSFKGLVRYLSPKMR